MKILFGTTNPAKVAWTKELLSYFDIEVITPDDLGIKDKPIENGKTPLENARIKCEFYHQYYHNVLCHDSGLFFEELNYQDPLQPSVHIRRPNNLNKSLNDDEMIEYYTNLIKDLGGKVKAYYSDGVVIMLGDEVFTKIIEDKTKAFTMVDKPCEIKVPGWPLDSISIGDDGLYFANRRKLVDKIIDNKENKSPYYYFYKEVFKK